MEARFPPVIYFRQLNTDSTALPFTRRGEMKWPGWVCRKSSHNPLNPRYITSNKSQVYMEKHVCMHVHTHNEYQMTTVVVTT